jgi:Zn-dependent protease with chaperone function
MPTRNRSSWTVTFLALAVAAATTVQAAETAKVAGYLEFRKPGFLIVDGQRIQITPKTKFRGSGNVKSIDAIPLGYEIKASGTLHADGTIAASALEARPNGMAFLEEDVLSGTQQAEDAYVEAAKVYQPGADGKEQVIGKLLTSGPQVTRARAIVDRLLPTYVDPKAVSVYVVENKEWNAMAMANFSIYVFSGLMADMDDDELAIVLGHEIGHATYEHSRKQAKKGMFTGIAGQMASLGAEVLDSSLARTAVQQGAALGTATFGNYFSRDDEDQADRVGLRYVYEAGYDYRKAPELWRRFAEKYGDSDQVTNFFFGDHSLSSKRAADLEREIAHNYADPAKDPPSHAKK